MYANDHCSGPGRSRQQVWNALHYLGAWTSAGVVADVCRKDNETVRFRLVELARQGRVEADGRNRSRRYRALGSAGVPVQ